MDDETTLDRVIRFLDDAHDMTRGEIYDMRQDLIEFRSTLADPPVASPQADRDCPECAKRLEIERKVDELSERVVAAAERAQAARDDEAERRRSEEQGR